MSKTLFDQAQFITSALKEEQFPQLITLSGKEMPEIAIVGRSNAGKSSLINHLLQKKKLAKVSATPGKTQTINFFTVDEQIALVDLPGFGYAKVAGSIKRQWASVIDSYLNQRKALKLILFLIDSRRDVVEEDYAFIRWASLYQKPLLLIFTKADKITESEKRKKALVCLNQLQAMMHTFPIRFLHYSIKDPASRHELINHINTLLD
jgi:GTP-binding protein